jgi:hypothetical protein
VSAPADSSVGGPSKKSQRSPVAVWLIVTLILIVLITAAPFIVSFGGAGIAGALGCDGSMQISSPCLWMGSDVSQTLTIMIYMGYLGFVTIPVGEFLLLIWTVVACVVALVRWRRRRRPV